MASVPGLASLEYSTTFLRSLAAMPQQAKGWIRCKSFLSGKCHAPVERGAWPGAAMRGPVSGPPFPAGLPALGRTQTSWLLLLLPQRRAKIPLEITQGKQQSEDPKPAGPSRSHQSRRGGPRGRSLPAEPGRAPPPPHAPPIVSSAPLPPATAPAAP